MLTLITMACDRISVMYLEDCINKDWVVPLGQLTGEEFTSTQTSDFHPGTYVCFDSKDEGSFYSTLYKVSLRRYGRRRKLTEHSHV
jgi:hypothetical protein